MVRFDVQSVLIFKFCMVYAPRGCLIRRIFVKFASFDVHWQIWSRFFSAFRVLPREPSSDFRNLRPRLSQDQNFWFMWNAADSCGFRFCSSYFSRRGTRTPRAPHLDDNVCASSSSLAFQVLLLQETMPWRILKGTTWALPASDLEYRGGCCERIKIYFMISRLSFIAWIGTRQARISLARVWAPGVWVLPCWSGTMACWHLWPKDKWSLFENSNFFVASKTLELS